MAATQNNTIINICQQPHQRRRGSICTRAMQHTVCSLLTLVVCRISPYLLMHCIADAHSTSTAVGYCHATRCSHFICTLQSTDLVRGALYGSVSLRSCSAAQQRRPARSCYSSCCCTVHHSCGLSGQVNSNHVVADSLCIGV